MDTSHTNNQFVNDSSMMQSALDPTNHINKLYTTVFCQSFNPSNGNKQVLLGMKKRGLGVDYWNGFGGKVEPSDQSIEQAACRELFEECGVKAVKLIKSGILLQKFPDQPRPFEIHVFTCSQFINEPIETDEMAPRWFDIDDIPYESMWKDDIDWYKHMLSGQPFIAYYLFGSKELILRGDVQLIDQSVLDQFKAELIDYETLSEYQTPGDH